MAPAWSARWRVAWGEKCASDGFCLSVRVVGSLGGRTVFMRETLPSEAHLRFDEIFLVGADATMKKILGLAALVSPLRALLVPAPASAVAKASAAHAPIGRRALFAAGAAGAATLTAALPAAAAGATGSDGKWAQRYDEFTGAHQLISTLWTSLAWRNCKSVLYLFASTANPSTPHHRRGFRGLFHRSVWPAIQGLRGRLRREAGKS